MILKRANGTGAGFNAGINNLSQLWSGQPDKFPAMAEVSKALNKSNALLSTWFEPERVPPGHIIGQQRPDWVLCQAGLIGDQGGLPCSNGLLNYGNRAALEFIKRTLAKRLDEYNIVSSHKLLCSHGS